MGQDNAREAKYLVVELGQLAESNHPRGVIGIPIAEVDQVIETERVTPVPLCPKTIEGITHHGGRLVTVIDPAIFLEMDFQPQPASLVLLLPPRPDQTQLGLKIARVRTVTNEGGLPHLPASASPDDQPQGEAPVRPRPPDELKVPILDVAALFRLLPAHLKAEAPRP